MLIRNLNTNKDLCNDTRLMIIELTDLLKCKILTSTKVEDIFFF